MTMPDSWFAALVPSSCVALAGLAAMLMEAFRRRGEQPPIGVLGMIGLTAALVASIALWDQDQISFGMVRADNFGLFASIIVIVVAMLTIALSGPAIEREGLPAGDYYAVLLFAVTGMILMSMAVDLLTIFLALEIMSIGAYVLTGIRRDRLESSEGAFKYFLLGAFSSAFFLYGIALTYTLTGTIMLDRIGAYVAAEAMNASPLLLAAMAMLIVGFAFKVSAVPFHMWAPDAYEGAPAIVTGFMSTAVKAAAFAAFVRVFLTAFEPLHGDWAPVLWVIAMLTMILGTVVGVAQSNLKRMLAYSSIAHAGYLLVGLVAANEVGKAAVLFYLLAYGVTNLGAFGIIALLGTRESANDELRDYAGLWYSRPALAALMAIFLLSLGGLPPTAGFVAKWYVFSAAVRAGYYDLAIVGLLTSVISVFFYLRVVVMMYMAEPSAQPVRPLRTGAIAASALAVTTAAVFYMGILPTRLIDLATASIATIF